MSYDLYLKPRSGSLNREAFVAHFDGNPLFRVDGDEIVYQNEATGTYFLFAWREIDQTANAGSEAEPEPDYPIWFNLNFFRPSTFALEAAPHLTGLVQALDLVVSDPQNHGMSEGDYSVEGFFTGWNAGNEWAVSRIIEEHGLDERIGLLPQADIHRTWSWNLGKARREAALAERGIDRFVPTRMYANIGGRVATLIVWPDGIPFECPPTDYVLVIRDQLAPRVFLRRKQDKVLVRWSEIEALIDRHGSCDAAGVVAFTFDRPPVDVTAFIKALPSGEPELELFSPDCVLDAEYAPTQELA